MTAPATRTVLQISANTDHIGLHLQRQAGGALVAWLSAPSWTRRLLPTPHLICPPERRYSIIPAWAANGPTFLPFVLTVLPHLTRFSAPRLVAIEQDSCLVIAKGGGNNLPQESSSSMATVTLKSLLEAGVHFGHRTKRWNPKMKPYIFTERNGVHIIDLQQTVTQLDSAYDYVRTKVGQGGNILFVGTKRQAADIIGVEARRCNMAFINKRWLGGTLTNFRTIRGRVEYMEDVEQRREYGEFTRLPKKEVLKLNEELERLHQRVGGLRGLEKLPDILFIVDVRREELAVKEASKVLNEEVTKKVGDEAGKKVEEILKQDKTTEDVKKKLEEWNPLKKKKNN